MASFDPYAEHACYHTALEDWSPRLFSVRGIAQVLLATGQYDVTLRALAARRRVTLLATAVSDALFLLSIDEKTAMSVRSHAQYRVGRHPSAIARLRHSITEARRGWGERR